jgi:cell division transport system permease protein
MRLNTLEFLLTQAWSAIVRNGAISGAAVTNVAVALCVLGAFALTAYNLDQQASTQAAGVEITADLGKGVSKDQVEGQLRQLPGVASVRFVGKQEALQQLGKAWNLDLKAMQRIGNPLPDAFHLAPADPNQVDALAASVKTVKGIAEVRYAQQTTQRLLTLARGIKLAGLLAVIVLGTATLLLVSVTIRLTIYARRREIRIMQLVGATNWFIRVPFLMEGIFQGFAGGVIAVCLLLPGYDYVQDVITKSLPFMKVAYSSDMMVLLAIGTVLLGCAFGGLGSLIGLQRHLQEV